MDGPWADISGGNPMDRFRRMTEDLHQVTNVEEFAKALEPFLDLDDPREVEVYFTLASVRIGEKFFKKDGRE